MYIDCLLDSAIPHELLNDYSAELQASAFRSVDVPDTIREDPNSASPLSPTSGAGSYGTTTPTASGDGNGSASTLPPRRTPKDIFRSSETMPLLQRDDDDEHDGERGRTGTDQRPVTSSSSSTGPQPNLPWLKDADIDSDDPIVTWAIWVNMIANVILLAGKIVVVASVPSMSVLASLVDAVLDFLSTAIVWTTTRLISSSQHDQYRYPVGRRR